MENSTPSPHSQRTVITLTSDGHETPPENPATELDTNSTPNAPNYSSVQQTPADETPQVPESAVLIVCHSSDEHHISPDILTVSSQTPVPQLLGDLIEKAIKSPKPFSGRQPWPPPRSSALWTYDGTTSESLLPRPAA